MTEAGRKITPPTKESPAFYYPVLAGYRESGSLVAGETSPPPTPVAKLLAKALAAQHYYVVGTKTPPPSLILVFHWGYMNPQIDDIGDSENPQSETQAAPCAGMHEVSHQQTRRRAENHRCRQGAAFHPSRGRIRMRI
jgi:hypothetical protein